MREEISARRASVEAAEEAARAFAACSLSVAERSLSAAFSHAAGVHFSGQQLSVKLCARL